MKPTTLKQPTTCAKQNVSSLRWPSLLQVVCSSLNALRSLTTHVLRVTQPGRNVLATAVNEVLSSKRYTAGVIFLMIVAPLSSIFYQLFNPAVFDKTWYYVNQYFFFYTLSPYLMLLFASIGIFLLFPVKCKTAYLATVLPVGYALAKLAFYSMLVHSNEQFHQSAPWFLILAGCLMAIGFLLATDYLLYRKYHLRAGTMARIIGTIKMPNVNPVDKIRILEQQVMELENFNQRF